MTTQQFILVYVLFSLVAWLSACGLGFGHFVWYDFWIGAFYDKKKRTLYICPLPCCVIKIETGVTDPQNKE
jgi:hypothetical protein